MANQTAIGHTALALKTEKRTVFVLITTRALLRGSCRLVPQSRITKYRDHVCLSVKRIFPAVKVKMVKIINFLVFAQKGSSDIYEDITSQIFGGLTALEPPQNWEQKGSKFGFFHCLFSSFIHLIATYLFSNFISV